MANYDKIQEFLINVQLKLGFNNRYLLQAVNLNHELPDEAFATIKPRPFKVLQRTPTSFEETKKMIDDRLKNMGILAKATLVPGRDYVTTDGRTDMDIRQTRIDPLPEYLRQEKREVSRLIKTAANYGCPNMKKERNARSKAYYEGLVVLRRQVVLAETFKQNLRSIRGTQCALTVQYIELMLQFMCNALPVFKRVLQIAEEGTGGLLRPNAPLQWES